MAKSILPLHSCVSIPAIEFREYVIQPKQVESVWAGTIWQFDIQRKGIPLHPQFARSFLEGLQKLEDWINLHANIETFLFNYLRKL